MKNLIIAKYINPKNKNKSLKKIFNQFCSVHKIIKVYILQDFEDFAAKKLSKQRKNTKYLM